MHGAGEQQQEEEEEEQRSAGSFTLRGSLDDAAAASTPSTPAKRGGLAAGEASPAGSSSIKSQHEQPTQPAQATAAAGDASVQVGGSGSGLSAGAAALTAAGATQQGAQLALPSAGAASGGAAGMTTRPSAGAEDSYTYGSPATSPRATQSTDVAPAMPATAAAAAATVPSELSPWDSKTPAASATAAHAVVPAAGSQAHTALLLQQQAAKSRPGSGKAGMEIQIPILAGGAIPGVTQGSAGLSGLSSGGRSNSPTLRLPMNPYSPMHTPESQGALGTAPATVGGLTTPHAIPMSIGGGTAGVLAGLSAPAGLDAQALRPELKQQQQPLTAADARDGSLGKAWALANGSHDSSLATPATATASVSEPLPLLQSPGTATAVPASRAGVGSRQPAAQQGWPRGQARPPTFTTPPQDWGWAEDPDAPPAWLERLAARTQLAQKMGLTAANAQRQRFQMAAAMQHRSQVPPPSMSAAVRITKPLPPPSYSDPSSPYLAALPGSHTRPISVAAGMGGGLVRGRDGGRGGAVHVQPAGVVSAMARPYSDLSPPRAPSPPGMTEVVTPFGPRSVHSPAARTTPPRYAGVSTRPASHAQHLLRTSMPQATTMATSPRHQLPSPSASLASTGSYGMGAMGDVRSSAPAGLYATSAGGVQASTWHVSGSGPDGPHHGHAMRPGTVGQPVHLPALHPGHH